ncbi:unnamed protein product [Choristocarpus tenellus]
MATDQEERREIEAYLDQHNLQAFLGDAVNDVVKERAEDPLVSLADALRASSKAARQILRVVARQVFNTEALPALEVEIATSLGIFRAAVSSGPFDGIETNHEGKGMLQAVECVHTVLAEKLVGKDPTQQGLLDQLLLQEPGTPANAVLATSMACCKAGAKHCGVEVFDHISLLANISEGGVALPVVSIINGGELAPGNLWVQDILLVPIKATSTLSCLNMFSKVHRTIAKVAQEEGQTLNRGPRGGFSSSNGSFDDLVECVLTAITNSGFKGQLGLAIDVHASRLVTNATDNTTQHDGQFYDLSKFNPTKPATTTTASDLMDTYIEWLRKYPIVTIVEPFAAIHSQAAKDLLAKGQEQLREQLREAQVSAEDGKGTTDLTPEEVPKGACNACGLGGDPTCFLQVVADAGVKSIGDINLANDQRIANTLLLTIRKGLTVSGCIALAAKARDLGWGVVVAGTDHMEKTHDTFVADLATGLKAGQVHLGGMGSAAALMTCCQMMRGEENGVMYLGKTFRSCG